MNIKQAKIQMSDAIDAYLEVNEFGDYEIPIERQRPIFLMGPPGVGKTAVMEQLAAEKDLALVSYTMTHHTRQSALGLPIISKRVYDGEEVNVSEYTSSEIITAVRDMIHNTGKKQGILFLDEFNCVSETLRPSMLRFLQYKTFGEQRVPEGWVVVAAGNPPEYNNSVCEFDIVTWDRLKRIDVEEDFDVWKEYAFSKGVHAAIITFLENNRDSFYRIETTANGKSFVTARGWVDLSDMLKIYEKLGKRADETLFSQYIQNKQIALEFATYYELFKKYGEDYHVQEILAGNIPEEVIVRIQNSRFDEQITVVGVVKGAIDAAVRQVYFEEQKFMKLAEHLRVMKAALTGNQDIESIISKEVADISEGLAKKTMASSINAEDKKIVQSVIAFFEEALADLKYAEESAKGFNFLKNKFDYQLKKDREFALNVAKPQLENGIEFFCNRGIFKTGTAGQMFMVNIATDKNYVYFKKRYPSDVYDEKNKDLLVDERKAMLDLELQSLDI